MKGKRSFHARNKRAELGISILDKYILTKSLSKDKDHYRMRKVSTHQKDTIILSIYVVSIRALNYMKSILPNMKQKINYFFWL